MKTLILNLTLLTLHAGTNDFQRLPPRAERQRLVQAENLEKARMQLRREIAEAREKAEACKAKLATP